MVVIRPPGRRARMIMVGLALVLTGPVPAQSPGGYPTGAIIQYLPQAGDPAEQLAAALRTLAVSPNDLSALLAAGRTALTLGDPNAAVGFFGRADEIARRDGRVKAGLGGALVALEKPRDALRYFQEAGALGVAEVDLAEDRGLAYDLIGDTARAQRDYLTVLAAHPDDDATRRRLALSQGIAGDRKSAIATLDPLIRKRDIAAWRAQTFVLAMTGDAGGANEITRIMVPQQAASLQPFLIRLATLSPADKARAVHFGEMPAAGRSYSETQLASVGPAPTYAPAPRAVPQSVPRPAPVAPSPVAAPAIRPSSKPERVVAVNDGRSRYVTADGTPMRRIVHTREEVFALGMPQYEYVPLGTNTEARMPSAGIPAPTVAVTQTIAAPIAQRSPAPPSASVRAPATATVASAATAAATVTPPPLAPATIAAADPSPAPRPVTSPAAVATVGPTGTAAMAMPLGSSAASGHYDLPHDVIVHQAVARTVQATARPPAVAAALAAARPGAPEYLADTWSAVPGDRPGAASANPVVLAARTATAPQPVRHRAAPVEIARADIGGDEPSTVARKHTATAVGPVASEAEPPATPEIASKSADARSSRHRRGRHADADPIDPDRTETRLRPKAGSKHQTTDDSVRSRKDATTADDDAESGKSDKTSATAKTGKHAPHHASRDGDDDQAGPVTSRRDKAESATPKVYVQVAGGANKADMDKAWAGVKTRAPELMKGRAPSTTPLHATNRLLVGPFKDDEAAQAFVNKMAAKGLSGFTFRSGKGQKVEKVDPGK